MYFTSKTLPRYSSCQAFQPIDICLRLFDSDGMALLKYLMDRDQGLERLNFVRKYWLSVYPEITVSAKRITTAG